MQGDSIYPRAVGGNRIINELKESCCGWSSGSKRKSAGYEAGAVREMSDCI